MGAPTRFAREFGYLPFEARNFVFRRATDVMITPLTEELSFFDIGKSGEELIKELETSSFSGCLKTSNRILRSRGMILLLKGRVAGCFFSQKGDEKVRGAQESLIETLISFSENGTAIMKYPLPEPVVASFSSLFLAAPADWQEEELSFEPPFQLASRSIAQNKRTAVISLNNDSPIFTRLVLFDNGEFAGFYSVDSCLFSSDLRDVERLISMYPDIALDVSAYSEDFEPLFAKISLLMSDFLGPLSFLK